MEAEPKTTTYNADLIFHVGESSYEDVLSELSVGDIVGIVHIGHSLTLASVKELDPLTLVDNSGNVIKPAENKSNQVKFLGRLAQVTNFKKVQNREELFDPQAPAKGTMPPATPANPRQDLTDMLDNIEESRRLNRTPE